MEKLSKTEKSVRGDFSDGTVWKIVVRQAVPVMIAQMVHILYNVVDRIFIGHMPLNGSIALTGVGLAFPITTLVMAFTSLFSVGGTPLFAIARGQKNEDRAETIMNQVVFQLISAGMILFFICYFFRKPILYLFGASDLSYPYADAYLKIYLWGTVFTMFSTGLNGFINAQGYPGIGMMTTMLGAVMNIALDPVFIYTLDMGVSGAAAATVISQGISAAWVLKFFLGEKTMYRFSLQKMLPQLNMIKEIVTLGIAGFIMQATTCANQIICNSALMNYGGDIYVSVYVCMLSIRDVAALPMLSVTSGAQPVISYNYGARKYKRMKTAMKFTAATVLIYAAAVWLMILAFPAQTISVFSSDPVMLETGSRVVRIYFVMFVFMSFQTMGQMTFTALGCTKRAICFSLLRKVVIAIPLVLILPGLGYGVNGIFMAEPVSDVIGGLASFITMYLTLYRKLPYEDE